MQPQYWQFETSSPVQCLAPGVAVNGRRPLQDGSWEQVAHPRLASPLCPSVFSHSTQHHRSAVEKGRNGLWSNVLRVCRESRTQPYSPPIHHPQLYLLFHSSPWDFQHQRSKTLTEEPNNPDSTWKRRIGFCYPRWVQLERRWQLQAEVCFAPVLGSACQRHISPAGASAIPLLFCPLHIVSSRPKQEFLQHIILLTGSASTQLWDISEEESSTWVLQHNFVSCIYLQLSPEKLEKAQILAKANLSLSP